MDSNVLCRRIGYSFSKPELLYQALTHRSYSHSHNERLEFLGDSILNFVIADELFKSKPDVQEGDLSRLRASLVNGESLASISRELQLGDYLVLGPGELKSGGFRRTSILADALESVLGAVYQDDGFETCRRLIIRLFENKLGNLPDLQALKDAKTRLQELLQARKIDLPEYTVSEVKGKAHAQKFIVECRIEQLGCVTLGEGRSRRKAEQHAAEQAYQQLHQQLNA